SSKIKLATVSTLFWGRRKYRYSGANLGSGNRCAHSPHAPKFTKITVSGMKREHPAVIKQAMGDAVRYYWEPSLIPTLHKLPIVRRSSKLTPAQCSQVEFHHNRSERRHAQVRVIQALIARLDLATLKIGTPLPDGTFLYRSFEEVWKLTDISYSRFKRSIA